MIVVVSHAMDPHALDVLEQLRREGADAIMFDTAQFPRAISLAVDPGDGEAWRAQITVDDVTHDLTQARVVWWRRPLPYELDDAVGDRDDREFAFAECQHAISGLWSALDATWVNDPQRDEVASRKLWQLRVAPGLGLRTPRTCVTNDPLAARRFVDGEGEAPVIYKAFGGTERAWRETRILRAGERDQLDAVSYAPVIFQEHVPAVADLRVTIVADEVFAAEIRSQDSAYPVDFRMDMDHAQVREHQLPGELEDRLRALMRVAGLVYGAIDLRLTPDGEYVFLEINPAGQWLFVERLTGQPITAALCAHMIAGDRVMAGAR